MVGLLGSITVIYGFYRLGIAGARTVGGNLSGDKLADTFIHSLAPIALAYTAAHYLTLLLYQGQAVIRISEPPLGFLASNPLGEDGVDIFGTANDAINYGVIGASTTWYWQVAFVVLGHVAALVLAHDRALVVYDDSRVAVRSQYWMLVVMVGFTSLALWLLAQSNG